MISLNPYVILKPYWCFPHSWSPQQILYQEKTERAAAEFQKLNVYPYHKYKAALTGYNYLFTYRCRAQSAKDSARPNGHRGGRLGEDGVCSNGLCDCAPPCAAHKACLRQTPWIIFARSHAHATKRLLCVPATEGLSPHIAACTRVKCLIIFLSIAPKKELTCVTAAPAGIAESGYLAQHNEAKHMKHPSRVLGVRLANVCGQIFS
eukprot:2583689-Pleurochrysis_carterae.AAC.2